MKSIQWRLVDCQGKASTRSTLTLIKKRQWTWCQMVLCREGHPTAKPASGAGQACVSTRMAANAPSAGLPGHPPSAEGQASMLVPSTGHGEVGQQVPRQACGHPGSHPGRPELFCESGNGAVPCGPQQPPPAMGLGWASTRDARSCKPTTDGHFHCSGTESQSLQTFCKPMTFTPTDPEILFLDIYPKETTGKRGKLRHKNIHQICENNNEKLKLPQSPNR